MNRRPNHQKGADQLRNLFSAIRSVSFTPSSKLRPLVEGSRASDNEFRLDPGSQAASGSSLLNSVHRIHPGALELLHGLTAGISPGNSELRKKTMNRQPGARKMLNISDHAGWWLIVPGIRVRSGGELIWKLVSACTTGFIKSEDDERFR